MVKSPLAILLNHSLGRLCLGIIFPFLVLRYPTHVDILQTPYSVLRFAVERQDLVSATSLAIWECKSTYLFLDTVLCSDNNNTYARSCSETTRMATAETSTQELTTFSRADCEDNNDPHEQQQDFQSLPPADSGKDAYLFLAACVGLEALVWGFPFAVCLPCLDKERNDTHHHHSSVSSKYTTTIMNLSPVRAAARALERLSLE